MAKALSEAQKRRALGISLAQDVAQLLIDQASEKGLSVSAYVERMVLERDWERRHLKACEQVPDAGK